MVSVRTLVRLPGQACKAQPDTNLEEGESWLLWREENCWMCLKASGMTHPLLGEGLRFLWAFRNKNHWRKCFQVGVLYVTSSQLRLIAGFTGPYMICCLQPLRLWTHFLPYPCPHPSTQYHPNCPACWSLSELSTHLLQGFVQLLPPLGAAFPQLPPDHLHLSF